MKRNLFIILLLVVAVALVAAAPAMARGPHGGKGQGMGFGMGQGMGPGALCNNPEVREKLGITDEQVAKLEQIRITFKRDMIELGSATQEAQLEMELATRSGRIDLPAAKKAAESLSDAQLAMMLRHLEHQATVQGVLTDTQIDQLRDLVPERFKQRRENRRHRKQGRLGQE